jgi:hypothetical protein
MIIELLVIFVVFIVLVTAYILPKKKHKDEKGLKPKLQCGCSISVRGDLMQIHGVPGFARISIYDEFMILSNIMKYKVNYRMLKDVKLQRRLLLSDALVLHLYGGSGSIYVYTNKAKEIYGILKSVGPRSVNFQQE